MSHRSLISTLSKARAITAIAIAAAATASALPPGNVFPLASAPSTQPPPVQSIHVRFDESDRQIVHLSAGQSFCAAEGDWVVLHTPPSVAPSGIAVVTGQTDNHPTAALRWFDDLDATESNALLIPVQPHLDVLAIPLRLRALMSLTDDAAIATISSGADGVCKVIQVAQDGAYVKMRGAAADPATRLGVGDRFDLFEDHEYIALGRVVAMDQTGTIEAEIMSALSRRSPATGNIALRRKPPTDRLALSGFVFRYERGFALISLGEADGMVVNDRLFGRLADGTDVEWVVDRVYPDHCSVTSAEPIQTAKNDVLWSPASTKPGMSVLAIADSDAWDAVESAPLALVKKSGLDQPTRPRDYVIRAGTFENVGIVLIDGPEAVLVRTIVRQPAAES